MKGSEEEWDMLKKVQQLDFVVIELTLYLDTHPNDEDIRRQWREAIKEAAKFRKQYEMKYGPLSLTSVPSKQAIDVGWQWNSTPWPWQL